ncbi:MAG: preprotein translocase subunit YajC [bacterium]|nr:preprotein translocase subunit YajC [bacterium]
MFFVLAQGAVQNPDPMAGIMQTFVMFGVIFLIFYFLLIRPQQKQQEKHKQSVAQLKKGDRIITKGGLYATIIGVKGETAAVKIGENTKVEIHTSAIEVILGDEEAK